MPTPFFISITDIPGPKNKTNNQSYMLSFAKVA